MTSKEQLQMKLDKLVELREEIEQKVDEFRDLYRGLRGDGAPWASRETYVFNHLDSLVGEEPTNRYEKCLGHCIKDVERLIEGTDDEEADDESLDKWGGAADPPAEGNYIG